MTHKIRDLAPDAGQDASSRIVAVAFAALIILNIAIPKGGISVGLPLTWGYMTLGLVILPAFLGMLHRGRTNPFGVLHFTLSFLPLTLFVIYKALSAPEWDVRFLPSLVNFFVLPLCCLVILLPYLEELTEEQIGFWIKWSVRFAVGWGLMNFFLYIVGKHFIEIPYITINAADAGEIFGKNNRRGSLMKLVSTYNNGNIFGVCMVMLFPIYLYFEKSRIWIIATIGAIVFSLSRTVWFGGICMFSLMVLTKQVKIVKLSTMVALIIGGIALIVVMFSLGWTTDKLADTDLGGRSRQFGLVEFSLFGNDNISIHELVYVSFLESFGFIGFAVAMLAMLFPVGFGLSAFGRLSNFRKAALAGYCSYLFCAFFDGAFIFPPVIFLLMLCCALLYRRGYVYAARTRSFVGH